MPRAPCAWQHCGLQVPLLVSSSKAAKCICEALRLLLTALPLISLFLPGKTRPVRCSHSTTWHIIKRPPKLSAPFPLNTVAIGLLSEEEAGDTPGLMRALRTGNFGGLQGRGYVTDHKRMRRVLEAHRTAELQLQVRCACAAYDCLGHLGSADLQCAAYVGRVLRDNQVSSSLFGALRIHDPNVLVFTPGQQMCEP